MVKQPPVLDDKLLWYKDAIIYELHIKAFRDDNGDGIGDFKGLLQKLDYLQELGVTAIWVLPFYPSPLKDDGYDIADYYNIHSSYGNIEQFKKFLQEAHTRNLKVITELVINHTSDEHPWFQNARLAPRGSAERDFYVWTDNPNQYKDVRIIFQDFEHSNWTWDDVAQQYYWHRFFHHQPDLNYDNILVQDEIFKIIDYWCALGVDGFRLDAVPYLFEREGTNGENLPETHSFLKKLRKHIDEHFPSTVFLAEANMWPEDSASYFGDGDECHMNYHFPLMPRMFMALQMEDQYPITDIFAQTPEIPENCQWAIFLRNHDELTLEMVTDEERDYMYKVYAKDPKAKINLGIRHRLAPLMDNNRRKIELLNSLLFSLPGTPVIYYGDEIGMGDNFYLGDRDGVRTPMQWSPDRNAGFSETNPQKLYLPVILDPEYHYETVNVETQRRNTSSLLWYMKSIISTRKKYSAFSRGDLKFIISENPKVLAFTRSYKDETLLIVVNLSKFSQAVELDLSAFKGFIPVEIVSRNKFPAIKEETPYFFTLSPHAYHWFALHKANPEVNENISLPILEIKQWDELLQRNIREKLEQNVLPGYLLKIKWFEKKDHPVYAVKIAEHTLVPLSENAAFFLLIEVSYERGLPDAYFLPVAFAHGAASKKIQADFPLAVIAELKIGNLDGILCDALYVPELQQLMFKKLAGNDNINKDKNSIQFNGDDSLKNHLADHKEVKPKLHPGNPDLTSITYDNAFFLKMYRKVDRATNPDLEISRYLSEKAGFSFTPLYIGFIEWKFEKYSIILGMMQEMVENHGNGHTFMLERMSNYIERILAGNKETMPVFERHGTLAEPIGFDELPEQLKDLIGSRTADQARLIGIRTGEMHKALAMAKDQYDFKPEEFSLHYQRSLFSSMQSLVRESFQNKQRHFQRLPDAIKEEVQQMLHMKEDILKALKSIYNKKLDVVKIRIHGNYDLAQVLLTGKDIAIQDFVGDSSTSYTDRRLKRSPLRDVAGMIRSFHNVAYEGVFLNNLVQKEDVHKIIPFAILWAHYITGFFMKAYLETIQGTMMIPKEKEDLKTMLKFYLLRKAFYDLNYELKNRPERVIVPLRLIRSIIR